MNWHQIKTNWKQARSKLRIRWPRLTEEDLDQIDGRDTELIGLLQQRYGISKEIAENEIREFGAGA